MSLCICFDPLLGGGFYTASVVGSHPVPSLLPLLDISQLNVPGRVGTHRGPPSTLKRRRQENGRKGCEKRDCEEEGCDQNVKSINN